MSAYAAPLPVRLLIAALILGMATVARFAIAPTVGDRLPYATYFLAVEISALLGGVIPGVFATLASAVLAHLYFSPIASPRDEIGLLLFVASCTFFSGVTEVLHRTRLKLAKARVRHDADIASRERFELLLTENAKQLQATIDAAPDAVLTMDSEGRVQSVNRAGTSMFGYSTHEIIGMTVEALVEPSPAEGSPPDNRIKILNHKETRAILGKRKDGHVFPAELTVSETSFDRVRLFVGFIKDLTERQKFEQKVEELHNNQLDALGGMASALAHEINQPLAATTTYLKVARLLLEKSPSGAGSDVLQVLEKATGQTRRAGRILASLRDLVQRGEPDKTLVGVNQLIVEAVDSLQQDRASDHISIVRQPRAVRDLVLADRTHLRQALVNLLRNAIEAMESADRRELLLSTSNPDDLTIRVDVIDTGCGLPNSPDRDCFEPFTTTKVNGMGVGLSVSRSIIEAHEGRIWAAPNADGGAVFSFTLPLQESDIAS